MGVEEVGKIVHLKHDSGATVEVNLLGATVTSWKVGGKEKFFVSTKTATDSSKPVRGGIPIVFPIFGPPPSSPPEYAALKPHGFVRSVDWRLDKVIMDRPEGISVRFLPPPPPSEFHHQYQLSYVVTLAAHQMSTDLHVVNDGKEDFKFHALLHNYLAVPDALKLSITGLANGVKYTDKTENYKEKVWTGEPLTITQETDAVFQKVPSKELKLDDGAGDVLTVRFRGFEDTTIWNPQEKTGSKMPDMEPNGWNRYVCIEPGFVSEYKVLKPGEEFLGQQVLSVA